MPASIASSLTIPDAAIAAAFVHGEQGVSTGSSTLGVVNFARAFNLHGGNYRIEVWGADVVTLMLGKSGISRHRVATVRATDAALTQSVAFAQQGTHRIDVTVVTATSKPAYFVLAIWQGSNLVYTTTSAAGWVWSTSTIADADVPSAGDLRLTMPVWTVSPNWQDGVTERLTWLTEIMASEADVEQRRSLRRYPRRSVEGSFLRTGPARQRIDSFLTGVGTRRFLVPLWFEQTKLPSAITPSVLSTTFPTGTLALREFAVGDLVLLGGEKPDTYDVSSIASIVGDTLTLGIAPTRTWAAGTRITPLRVARIAEKASLDAITATVGRSQVRFDLDEPERGIVPDWGYCAPLWRFKVDRQQNITSEFERNAYVFDVDTGRIEVMDPGDTARVRMKANITLFGREKLRAFRSFIANARGKAVRFWWPSGTHDLEPVAIPGGLTMDVAEVGVADWLAVPQDARRMLAIVFSDGRPTMYRQIAAVSPQAGFDRLTLTAPLPALARSEIERISYVLPARFDQDGFELSHVTNDGTAVRAAVVVRSSEIAGMPPIDCWVTSMPYPVQINEDGLQMSATILGGTGSILVVDSLDMSATVVDGSFPAVLRTLDAGNDAIDVSATVIDGSFPLTVIYTTYTTDTDALDVAATVISGTLVASLVSTVMDTDSIETSATILGGTLT